MIQLFTIPVSVFILFGRFICATILHLSLVDEVTKGMTNLKFCINHDYMFANPNQAAVTCLLQTVIVIMVEIVNIEIILTSIYPTDIVYNFIALAIIAEFDDFVYQSLRSESLKKLIDSDVCEKILIIRHTSSKKCKDHELSDIVDENGDLRPLKISWKTRNCTNKFFYCFYRVLRTFYVSVYFYFLPFMSIILTCFLPIYIQITNEINGVGW